MLRGAPNESCGGGLPPGVVVPAVDGGGGGGDKTPRNTGETTRLRAGGEPGEALELRQSGERLERGGVSPLVIDRLLF